MAFVLGNFVPEHFGMAGRAELVSGKPDVSNEFDKGVDLDELLSVRPFPEVPLLEHVVRKLHLMFLDPHVDIDGDMLQVRLLAQDKQYRERNLIEMSTILKDIVQAMIVRQSIPDELMRVLSDFEQFSRLSQSATANIYELRNNRRVATMMKSTVQMSAARLSYLLLDEPLTNGSVFMLENPWDNTYGQLDKRRDVKIQNAGLSGQQVEVSVDDINASRETAKELMTEARPILSLKLITGQPTVLAQRLGPDTVDAMRAAAAKFDTGYPPDINIKKPAGKPLAIVFKQLVDAVIKAEYDRWEPNLVAEVKRFLKNIDGHMPMMAIDRVRADHISSICAQVIERDTKVRSNGEIFYSLLCMNRKALMNYVAEVDL